MSWSTFWPNTGEITNLPISALIPQALVDQLLSGADELARFSSGTGDERGDTRERILSSALRSFANNGFQGTSIRDVAQEVGIKAPGVYAHFSSKSSLLAAALSRAMRSFVLFIVEDDSVQYSSLAEFVVRKHARFQLSNANIAAPSDSLMVNVQFLEEVDPEFVRVLKRVQRTYIDLLELGLTSGSGQSPHSRTDAHIVITMCDGVNRWYQPGGRLSTDQVETYMWESVRAMLNR